MAETAPIKQKFIIEVDGEGKIKAYTEDLKKNEKAVESNAKSQDKLGSAMKKLALGIGAMFSIQKVTEYVTAGVKANEWLIESDTRLYSIAKKVTKATDEQVDALRRLADQTELTTAHEAEATKVGLSQLLTFGMTTDSAMKLNDAMQDLASAQFGLNVKGNDLIGVANMLGKAFQGQGEAMQRVGVTMTDAQKKMIDMGDEGQRVATISAVIAQNFGGLSESLKNTDSGKIAMMKHDLGTLQESLTGGLLPVLGETATAISGVINSSEMANDVNASLEMWKTLGIGIAEVGKIAYGVVAYFNVAGTAIAKVSLSTASALASLDAWRIKNESSIGGDPLKSKRYLEAKAVADELKRAKEEVSISDEITKQAENLKVFDDFKKKINAIDSVSIEANKLKEAEIAKQRANLEALALADIDSKEKQKEAVIAYAKWEQDFASQNADYMESIAIEAKKRELERQETLNKTLAEKKKIAMSASIQRDDADNYDVRDLEELGRIPISEHWIKEEQAIAQAKDSIINSAMSIGNSVVSISNSIASAKMREIDSQIAAVKASNMSDKQKEASIKSLESKRRDEMRKSAIAGMIMAQANAGIGVASTIGALAEAQAKVLAGTPGGPAMRIAAAIAVGAAGAGFIATAIQQQKNIQNAGKFYYGSKNSSGAYQEIGGNGASDNITANVRSGELIVKAGEDARRAKQALNGGGSGGMQSINFGGISVAISGNADESVISQIPAMIERGVVNVIEKARFTNSFNPALRSR